MSDDRSRRERRFWAPDVRKDVDDELAHHLEMREREFVARGLSPAEAREAARRKFGNAERIAADCRDIDERRYREERRASMWNDFRQDVAYGVRLLRRAPGFTAVAVVTLALGIGATTAIFSVIDAALLRPLPYPDPHQLVTVTIEVELPKTSRVHRVFPSLRQIREWRQHRDVVTHIAAWNQSFQPVVVDGPEPQRVPVTDITEDFLGLFGVVPAFGRGFDAADMAPGAEPVVLLGHAFWEARFAADPAAIGHRVRLDNTPVTIVGVLPATFHRDVSLWRPLRGPGSTAYARLREGVTPAEAARRLHALLPAEPDRLVRAVHVSSLYDSVTSGYRFTTAVIAASIGVILLIACINVAGLLLARGINRRPELAVRATLGAGRARLLRQLLAENLMLSLAGATAGILLAVVSLDVLVANLPLSLPPDAVPSINLRVLPFALGMVLLTTMLFGLVPALRTSRVDVASALVDAGRRHSGPLSIRGGQMLIAAEVALAIVLLAGAGLMLRSFVKVMAVDLGFEPARIVTMDVSPVDGNPDVLRHYYPAVVDILRRHPGIEAAGAVDFLPLGETSVSATVRVGDRSAGLGIREFVPGYFEAAGFTLEAGRFVTPTDIPSGTPSALVNAGATNRLFPGASPLGQEVVVWGRTYQIVGVVSDVRHAGPLAEAWPEIYLPFGTPASGKWPLVLVVRSTLPRADLERTLRDATAVPGPRVIVGQIRQGTDLLAERVVTPRQRTVLLGLLGGAALVLTLVGIFGTTAYAVGRRTQEIGVRMALGARPQQVVAAVLRDALWPALAGIILGLGAATLATRVIASFLFKTDPTDPGTFAAAAMLMLAAATLAAWIPARRAAQVDPVEALRVG